MKTCKVNISKTAIKILATVIAVAGMVSCDSFIYQDLEPCKVEQKLKFISDYNLLEVDAFSKTVSSVSVVAFDSKGIAIWTYSESGEALKAEDYAIDLAANGCPTGRLTFVAWCGLDNKHNGATEESFTVPEIRIGETRIEELQCRLNRSTDAGTGQAVSDKDLHPLYHGILRNVILSERDDITDHLQETYTIPLIKDTNSVRVILQNLSGHDLDPHDFSYTIEESNGLMYYDNTLRPDETIQYRHWQRPGGSSGVEMENGNTINVNVAMGDLTVARLMADRKSYLTIRYNPENKMVARVPLTDYALLVKDHYTRDMDDQEYLDRQDHYSLTFFIDNNHNWISAVIYINSWKVMLDNIDFD